MKSFVVKRRRPSTETPASPSRADAEESRRADDDVVTPNDEHRPVFGRSWYGSSLDLRDGCVAEEVEIDTLPAELIDHFKVR